MTIGEILKVIRCYKKLELEEISESSGINVEILYDIEQNNINADIDTVIDICNVLNISSNKLFDFYINVKNDDYKIYEEYGKSISEIIINYLINEYAKYPKLYCTAGNNIRLIRESKKLSINKLGELANVNASYISALENYKKNNPSFDILEKLAESLDVSVYDLLKVNLDNISRNNKYYDFGYSSMEILLKQKVLKDYIGVDFDSISDKEMNEIIEYLINQFEFIRFKYNIKKIDKI